MVTKREIAYIAFGLFLMTPGTVEADTVAVNQCTTNDKDSVIVTQCSDGTVTVVNTEDRTVLICHTKDAGHAPVCVRQKIMDGSR